MNKYIFFFLSQILLLGQIKAQNSTIEVDNDAQDMGVLENYNNIQSQFIIKNNSPKNLYILRADAGRRIKVTTNKKTIRAGDTTMLFVNIELLKTGKLYEEIKLVTSADAEPYLLKVKADVKNIKYDDKTACFYFNKPDDKKKESKEGVIIEFPVTSENKEEKGADIIIPDDAPEPEIKIVELDRELYKQNNITFLMDVSYSMKDSMNLPLAKEAMYTLINVLRDIDTVSLITYSDSVRIIKEGIKGDNKSTLNNSVADLYAKGPTMGAKAILFSLDIAMKYYIEDGNNQLFLVTDGRFEFTEKHYEQWKEKVGDKKITLTILALGHTKSALQQLQEMSEKREGSFLKIENHEDAKIKLLEEVKKQSIKD